MDVIELSILLIDELALININNFNKIQVFIFFQNGENRKLGCVDGYSFYLNRHLSSKQFCKLTDQFLYKNTIDCEINNKCDFF